ncbi:MAG: ABC transporter ATP-binding protein [Patescibacteria group bacterium]
MPAILVENLSKSYGQLRAVDGINFAVEEGEIFGLLGPNGAGKTTTVEILAGLRQRDGGNVSVLGMDPGRRQAELKNRIGVQLQQAALYPRLTVLESARLFASFYRRRLDPVQVVQQVGLAEKAGTQTRKLSGGQKQRLAIALTMVGDADLVFLDEPTTGLDPQARRSLWDLILGLKKRGKTVFLTTHYMEEAERLCDRVAIIDRGRIIAMDSPRALIDQHFNQRAVEFESDKLARDQTLGGLPGVTKVRQNGDNVVTLYSTDITASIDALMRYSREIQAPVEDLVVRHATLEDVFLKLTGRRIRE